MGLADGPLAIDPIGGGANRAGDCLLAVGPAQSPSVSGDAVGQVILGRPRVDIDGVRGPARSRGRAFMT